MTTELDELTAAGDGVRVEDVAEAWNLSTQFLYEYELSSWQLLIDVLAKLLIVTAVFADLVLRAALAAWKNDRALRSRTEATAYDAGAAALSAALS